VKLLPLSKGEVAIVDDGDFVWLSQGTWHLHDHGYAQGRLNGARGYMHRMILGLEVGKSATTLTGIS